MEKTVEELYENIEPGRGKIEFLKQLHYTFVDFIKKENPEGAAIYMEAMAKKQNYDVNVVKTLLIVSNGHPNADIIDAHNRLNVIFKEEMEKYNQKA